MPESPTVMLEWHRDWCARHLEPFRAEWPKGSAVAMALLFQAFATHPDVLKFCGRDDATTGQRGDPELLPAALAELGPACCLVGPSAMAVIYQVALKRQPVNPIPGSG